MKNITSFQPTSWRLEAYTEQNCWDTERVARNWRGMWCYLRVQQICHRLFLVILSLWIPLKACQREAISDPCECSCNANLTFLSDKLWTDPHKESTLFNSSYKVCCNNPTDIIKTKKLIVTHAFQVCQPYSYEWNFPLDV